MRLSLLLVLALACLAAAEPHGDAERGPHHRPRRFLPGWDAGDSFFHNVAAEVRRAWAASARWVKHLFAWARHHPEHSTVYRLRVPHGSGIVAVIHAGGQHGGQRGGQHGGQHHQDALVWDGKQLAWQRAGHGVNKTASDGTITVAHSGVEQKLPLALLAKYLSHVPAGSQIDVEIRGSSWSNLRVVLRVIGPHGEDQKKSVSVLLSTLLKEIQEHQKHHKASKAHSTDSSSTKSSSSSKKSPSSSKKSPSSKLRWDGRKLLWAGVKLGSKHVRRQLRVTQDGVSQVVPFSVLAKHLKTIPAHSDISFEITGHTLKDLRVLLHVHNVHGVKKHTISLLVAKLVKEAEASKHGASAKQSGPLRARVELKHRDEKKGKKKYTESVPVAQARQV